MTITTRQTQRMGFRAIVLASTLLPSTAIVSGYSGATYKLTSEAMYAKGCFDPCLCPILDSPVTGTFRLTPVTLTGTYDEYAVSNVDWHITDTGQDVSGGGTLTNFSEVAALQRLEVDLTIGTQEPLHLDSQFVTPGAVWPELSIAVSMNNFFCYDTAFWVRATPIKGDVNGDAIVNGTDLLAVLNSWGECPPDANACPADLSPIPNGDGVVSTADLLTVIEGWGG